MEILNHEAGSSTRRDEIIMNPLDFLNTTNYPSSFLEGTFGDKFYSQSVEPAKLGTGPKPPLGQVAKNWNPLKAFTPKMLATGPTPAASKFLGSNIAYGLPFAYAGGADLLQDRLEKQGLTGEGGIYDVSGGWGPEAAGADVEYDFDNIYNDDNEPGTIDVSDPRFNQAGIGIISGLNKLFGPKIASYLKNKAITKGVPVGTRRNIIKDRIATQKGIAQIAMQKKIQAAEAAAAANAANAAKKEGYTGTRSYDPTQGGGGHYSGRGGSGSGPQSGSGYGPWKAHGGLIDLYRYGGFI